VPLADGDLVDGDLLELVQPGLAEAALQGPGLDVLDGVPADLKVLGHVLDGHVPRQVQDVALEGAGVVLVGIGEAQLDLAGPLTVEAIDARHLERQQRRPGTDRHQAEGAFDATLSPDFGRATVRAAPALAWLLDAEDDPALTKVLAYVTVADQAEAVIQ
jgi:hypothetical protein